MIAARLFGSDRRILITLVLLINAAAFGLKEAAQRRYG